MSQTDSFIEEVTEELRRDQLFATFRKYGWVAALGIVFIVGGAAYYEWRQTTQENSAQAQGDAILSALEGETPEERAEALSMITDEAGLVARLLEANAYVEAGDEAKALDIFDAIAAQPLDPRYTDMAKFKALLIRGATMDPVERTNAFAELSLPGRPYRLIATEQGAIAMLEQGKTEEGLAVLTALLSEAFLPSNLERRVKQIIVANGGDIAAIQ